MWSRVNLKQKGKYAFKRNYWKTVLISVLVMAFTGGSFATLSYRDHYNTGHKLGESVFFKDMLPDVEEWDEKDETMDALPMLLEDYFYNQFVHDRGDGFYVYDNRDGEYYLYEGEDFDEKYYDFNDSFTLKDGTMYFSDAETKALVNADLSIPFALFVVIFIIAFIIGACIGLAVGLTINAFLLNPLDVGLKRYFLVNLNNMAEVKEAAFGFDHNYKNVVKVSFFRDLYTVLWSLLFIVPGIVKSYEYRMIPYLLAEYPYMTKEEAFAASKKMMDGQKWNAFVLDLSFLGWGILSAMTLGILGIFYVNPYRNMTNAGLYEALKYGGQPMTGGQPVYGQNPYSTLN